MRKGVMALSNLGRYQEIIEEAYQAGGPDIYLDNIRKIEYAKGACDMSKTAIGTAVIIGVVGLVVFGWRKVRANKKREKAPAVVHNTQLSCKNRWVEVYEQNGDE